MKNKQKTMWTIIVMVVIVIAVTLVFWQIIEKKRTQSGELAKSKVQEVNAILKKDFVNDYPATPREVVNLYSRISICLYNQKLSDNDFKALVQKMRLMFDDELLTKNPEEIQIQELQNEVKEFRDEKKYMSSYTVDKNSAVEKGKVNGRACASLKASYLISNGKDGYTKSYERFVLRKDNDGKWKILGWELVSGDAGNNEE